LVTTTHLCLIQLITEAAVCEAKYKRTRSFGPELEISNNIAQQLSPVVKFPVDLPEDSFAQVEHDSGRKYVLIPLLMKKIK
jgi:hypothetical protein